MVDSRLGRRGKSWLYFWAIVRSKSIMSERGSKIVVCGATGYLGRAVLQAADRAGHRVRALARDAGRLEPVRDACAEVFVGEATRPATLEGLFDGAEVAFSALGRPERFGHVPPALMRFAASVLRPLNANASAFVELFASLGESDAVAPSFGRRRLDEQMQVWARPRAS